MRAHGNEDTVTEAQKSKESPAKITQSCKSTNVRRRRSNAAGGDWSRKHDASNLHLLRIWLRFDHEGVLHLNKSTYSHLDLKHAWRLTRSQPMSWRKAANRAVKCRLPACKPACGPTSEWEVRTDAWPRGRNLMRSSYRSDPQNQSPSFHLPGINEPLWLKERVSRLDADFSPPAQRHQRLFCFHSFPTLSHLNTSSFKRLSSWLPLQE